MKRTNNFSKSIISLLAIGLLLVLSGCGIAVADESANNDEPIIAAEENEEEANENEENGEEANENEENEEEANENEENEEEANENEENEEEANENEENEEEANENEENEEEANENEENEEEANENEENEEEAENCTLSQGFWRNHAEEWPVEELTLGGVTYSQEELLDIFNTPPRGDATYILMHQLIAAQLNIEQGADDAAIADVLTEADSWLTENSLGSDPSGSDRTPGIEAAGELDSYNNGFKRGPGHCDNGEEEANENENEEENDNDEMNENDDEFNENEEEEEGRRQRERKRRRS